MKSWSTALHECAKPESPEDEEIGRAGSRRDPTLMQRRHGPPASRVVVVPNGDDAPRVVSRAID